ncbi:hypothetical protein, partial [Catenovulum maritimum]
MKFYFSIPILLGICLSILSVLYKSFDFYSFLISIFGGTLFYCTPYIAWLIFTYFIKPANAVVHAGYIGSTLSLVLISSFWLLPQDPSGLPIQWMAYWPLSGILIMFCAVVTYVYIRVR